MNPFLYFRPGDWGVLLLGSLASAWLATHLWHGDGARTVIIRSGGHVVAEAPLTHSQRISVTGPLGVSLIDINQGRVRVAADPSPRQLCVKQGWLSHAGDAALCLPNQISIELAGASRRFDSLSY